MQRLLYSIFISFFLILSCAKSKPKDIISESKMTEVLTQVSILDGYLNTLPSDSAKKVMPILYEKIFKQFDLDSARFVRNLDYYFADPNLTEKIYSNVSKELTVYDRKFNAEDSIRQVFVQDSLNRHYYFQRIYDRQQAMRYYNSSDTLYTNYYAFNRRVIQESPLDFLNHYLNMVPVDPSHLAVIDSVASGKYNKLEYLLIYKDTTEQQDAEVANYKRNSEIFLQKLRLQEAVTGAIPTASPSYQPTDMFERNGSQPQEVPTQEMPQPTEELISDTSNNEILVPRPDKQINDRMIKPVRRRELPQ